MSGEFVRTPKKGDTVGQRYRTRADLPMTEVALCLLSFGSTVASIETGHWFATPFAGLFTFGYGYVATLVATEQFARRRAAEAAATASSDSLPPAADSLRDRDLAA